METRFLHLHELLLHLLYFQSSIILVIIVHSSNLVCFSNAEAQNYIIHMDLDAMPGEFSDQHSWFLSTLDSISSESSDMAIQSSSKLLYSYKHVIHGFSARLTPTELENLTHHPGYLHSTPDTTRITKDTTYTPQFLGLTDQSAASHSHVRTTTTHSGGKDIIIGLVDSGIWPESKSFNDHGLTNIPSRWKGFCQNGTDFPPSLCNKKLIGARYFNRGLTQKDPNITIPVNSTRDTDGHGTHTSSTAAGAHVAGANYFGYGTGTASGMAPEARVAMYKALWDEGGSTADIMAAVDAAIEDGVDILSLSLGMDILHLYDDVIAIATFAAMEKGVFVTLSAGNEGPLTTTLHNGTPWGTTVAAGMTDRRFGGTVTVGNRTVVGSTLYPLNSTIRDVKLMFMDGCDDLTELKKLTGDTLVVCLDVNGTAVDQQIDNLDDDHLHFAGAIFVTNSTGLSVLMSSGTTYPAIFLDHKAGKIVTDYIQHSNNLTEENSSVSLEFGKTFLGASVAPRAAVYTSRGPSRTCPEILKPDLMAPGDLILASWTESISVTSIRSGRHQHSLYSSFNIVSGTSMSTPHVAGVAALIKAAHPDWSPAAIRSALITTANPLDSSGKPMKDYDNRPASALAMGAGEMRPDKALDPGLVYDAGVDDYVNFLCGLSYTETQIRVITRRSARVSCENSVLTRDLNYPSFIVLIRGEKGLEKVFERVLTNVGDGASEYEVKVEGFRKGGEVEVEVEVKPEKLVFKERNEKRRFKVKVKASGEGEGSITWVETRGRYVVRSPIIVTKQ